jgi:hypothetical protein
MLFEGGLTFFLQICHSIPFIHHYFNQPEPAIPTTANFQAYKGSGPRHSELWALQGHGPTTIWQVVKESETKTKQKRHKASKTLKTSHLKMFDVTNVYKCEFTNVGSF